MVVPLTVLVAGLIHVGIPRLGANRFSDVQLRAYIYFPIGARGSGFKPAQYWPLVVRADLVRAYWSGSRAWLWVEVSDVFQGHPSAKGGSGARYSRLELKCLRKLSAPLEQ